MAWIKYEDKLAGRQRKRNARRLREVFNELDDNAKLDMMVAYPELYFAVVRIAVHEDARDKYKQAYGR